MTYAKGLIGVRWTSSDENGDSLIYTVEIRGSKEQNWKLAAGQVARKILLLRFHRLSRWRIPLRITASDAPSNTPDDTLTTSKRATVHHRQHAARNHGTRSRERRRPLACRRRPQHHPPGRVLARRRRLDRRRSGHEALRFAGPRLRTAPAGALAGRAPIAVRVEDDNDNAAVASATWK